MTIWDEILATIQRALPPDDFRRWFGDTAYASDSGDQITVWVPTESIRRHIALRYQDDIAGALSALNRDGTQIRFIVTGIEEEEADQEDND
jgi:chromosomal replication initiation ATPase DnaA